jgi:hypothetical protein
MPCSRRPRAACASTRRRHRPHRTSRRWPDASTTAPSVGFGATTTWTIGRPRSSATSCRSLRRSSPSPASLSREAPSSADRRRKRPASEPEERRDHPFFVKHGGFDVHCAARVAADDDEGRERLVRYCARPPFALERIEELQDGRIAYRMKTAPRGSSLRVMTPVELQRSREVTTSAPAKWTTQGSSCAVVIQLRVTSS